MARLAPARIGALAVTTLLLLGALSSCATTARIDDVYMALDGNGDRRRSVFVTDTKEIHCVVEMGIGRPGATVEALIRQLQAYDFVQDVVFETDRVIANAEQSPQPASGLQKLDIALKPLGPDGSELDGAPFPRGHYQCEAYLDGALTKISIFNIDFAPCPTALITTGTTCYGFYKKGDTCPRYGLTSRDPLQCHCSIDQGWLCDS